MPRSADPSRDLHAQQAAYLRGQHNLSQEEIGKILGGISQPHVSRLLARAEKMGWLITETRFVDTNIPDDTLQQFRHLLEPRDLALALSEFGRRESLLVPQVRVFDSGGRANSTEVLAIRRRRFGRSAAGRLEELLRGAELMGVAWGSTVAGIIEGLGTLGSLPRHDRKVRFIPVCAELIGLGEPAYSSSRLVSRLDLLVNDIEGEQLSLAGVPAYIPRRYSKKNAAIIRQFVTDSASHKMIFSGPGALVNRLDGLLTSIGSMERPVGGSMPELLAAGGIDGEQLRSLIVGDIGGTLVAKQSLSTADERLVEELNLMWTGISIDHIKNIASQAARSSEKPGSIVVAVGSDRASVAFEIIQRELVNELIIDMDLSRSLEKIVLSHLASE